MYTSTKTFELNCPAGETGAPFTATATYESLISQADADNTALQRAMAIAYALLQCSLPPVNPPTLFYSAVQIASAPALIGFQPRTFFVTLPAGYVYSLVSVAAANSAAQTAAQAEANLQRDRGQVPIFYNRPQSWAGACSAAQAPYSVSVTVSAGTLISMLSQADADNKALVSAQSQVAALIYINCASVYSSTTQTFTTACAVPLVGNPVTVTNPSGFYLSNVSQADADSHSLAAATAAAVAAIVCAAGYWNTAQTVTVTCLAKFGINWVGAPSTYTQPANTKFSLVSLAAANALAAAVADAAAVAVLQCRYTGGLNPP